MRQVVAWVLAATCWLAMSEARAAYTDAEIAAVRTAEDTQVAEIRDQEVTQLRIALARRLPQNRQAELYFRLAEIYLEAYRSEFILEGRVHEKRVAAGEQGNRIDRERSRVFLKKGIEACRAVLSLKIPYSKLDRIHYFLAVNHLELGDERASQEYFAQLARKFPESPFTLEAYRELGDMAFYAADFPGARDFYLKAAARDDGTHLGVARVYHKLAWAYYRMRDPAKAVQAMKKAVQAASRSGEKLLSIREEALRDMAIFMTEAGQVDEAIAYFQETAGDKSFFPKLLERLAAHYERNVEPAKAARVYEVLLRTDPGDELAFRVKVKLLETDIKQGKALSPQKRVPLNEIPGDAHKSSDTATRASFHSLKATARKTATDRHEEFRRSGARGPLELARTFYEYYLLLLEVSSTEDERPEIEMYLADVKRELGDAEGASKLYKKVLASGNVEYARQAGALWAASLEEAVRKRPNTDGASAPSALEKDYVRALDDMREAIGSTPEGRTAALKAAQVLSGYPETRVEGTDRCKDLIEDDPGSPQALVAARLWVQNIAENGESRGAYEISPNKLEEARVAVEALKSNAALMAQDAKAGGKLGAYLAAQEKRLQVGKIARLEKEKDFVAAGEEYVSFAGKAKDRESAEKAYANAVLSYNRASRPEQAEQVLAVWGKRYPGSRSRSKSSASAATVALILGRFEVAASIFKAIGAEGGGGEALITAARIHQGTGHSEKAREVWNLFLKKYPKHAARWSVALDLAESYEIDGQEAAAVEAYGACGKGPSDIQAQCYAMLGDLYLRKQDVTRARSAYGRAARQKGKNLSPFVGYARYRIAELSERDAHFAPLQYPEKQLERGLGQRLEFFSKLGAAYNSSLDAGGPWGIAGLDRLAAWAIGFSVDLKEVPAPAGADAKSVEAFKQSLQATVLPLRRKAAETWMTAYTRAVKDEVLCPVIPDVVDRLADVRLVSSRKGLPFRAQGARGKFRISGVPADGGQEGRAGALERVRRLLIADPLAASSWVDYGNLLWGEGLPMIARIAYDRAVDLAPGNAAALNNRAVVLVSGGGQEDWNRASEARELLRQSIKKDRAYLPAKMNLALLYNYYRLYARAKPLWTSILTKVSDNSDVLDGLAIARIGLRELGAGAAQEAFDKATALGASRDRFARVFHEAALVSDQGTEGARKCLTLLAGLDESALVGFERSSYLGLRKACDAWK